MIITAIIRYIISGVAFHIARQKKGYSIIAVLLLILLPLTICFAPSSHFPSDAYITIREGSSVGAVADELKERGLISSPLIFKILARVTLSEQSLQSGNYLFEDRIGTLPLLLRLRTGDTGIAAVRFTVPEGYTTYQIAALCEEILPRCSSEAFLLRSANLEGYLFPDTYVLPGDATAEDVIKRMRDNFYRRVASIQEDIDAYDASFSDILTMASLLEKEARTTEERRVIAGILWKRLENNMPLQVDAVFGYIQKRETFHPSLEDLEVDSPYNTYKYRGLPPTPIANSGLDAILSAVTPIDTPYLYYLTGRDGRMYYASTFEEHKENRALYLD